jgi:hypothetical protein
LILIPYDAPTPINEDNIFAHVFYGLFDRFRPHSVFVSGVKKIENYKVLGRTPDGEETVENLWNRIRGEL